MWAYGQCRQRFPQHWPRSASPSLVKTWRKDLVVVRSSRAGLIMGAWISSSSSYPRLGLNGVWSQRLPGVRGLGSPPSDSPCTPYEGWAPRPVTHHVPRTRVDVAAPTGRTGRGMHLLNVRQPRGALCLVGAAAALPSPSSNDRQRFRRRLGIAWGKGWHSTACLMTPHLHVLLWRRARFRSRPLKRSPGKSRGHKVWTVPKEPYEPFERVQETGAWPEGRGGAWQDHKNTDPRDKAEKERGKFRDMIPGSWMDGWMEATCLLKCWFPSTTTTRPSLTARNPLLWASDHCASGITRGRETPGCVYKRTSELCDSGLKDLSSGVTCGSSDEAWQRPDPCARPTVFCWLDDAITLS